MLWEYPIMTSRGPLWKRRLHAPTLWRQLMDHIVEIGDTSLECHQPVLTWRLEHMDLRQSNRRHSHYNQGMVNSQEL